ncbi:Serine/threonine-protein kinase ssp1 [Hypsizygus marmoreus]|uniref:Serine/threonine-protein kinase ssp1 n=1 Tax=Hypsizygus marmoreus TaxID=39966 RepID=A0A369JUI5_HYPMA|nr:Serine/threonine-protein kinase ssp1 [Hypsizygus marmoreus]
MQDAPPPVAQDETVRITSQLYADRRRKVNQYARQERIGKGQHGEVFLCTDEELNREVALKIVKRNNPRDKIKLLRRNNQQQFGEKPVLSSTEHSIRREIAVMRKCRHANIARLLEVIDDPKHDKIYLAMEYLSGGQVQWTDPQHQPMLSIEETRSIIRDVILGLEYLHHHGIIHRDIKPANLLWTRDRTIVKIIDFGVSYFHPDIRHAKSSDGWENPSDDSLFQEADLLKRTGTPSFLAPEVVWIPDETSKDSPANSADTLASGSHSLKTGSKPKPSRRPPITKAIDIWSLAVTFYCLLFGHTPFNVPESANENAYHNEFVLYNQICTQDWDVDETMGSDHLHTGGRHPKDTRSESSLIVALLDHMLQKDPKSRVTLPELKRNPWILSGIPEPKDWLIKTSPAKTKGPSACRWIRQASRRILELLPTPRRIPPI